MKKSTHFFMVLAFIVFSNFSSKAADVVWANFESDVLGKISYGSLWANQYSGVMTAVANPQTTGLNNFSKCVHVINSRDYPNNIRCRNFIST